MIVTVIATISASAAACSPDYGPELQRIRDQNTQYQEDAAANKARIDQLEKSNQETSVLAERIAESEQAAREVSVLAERVDKLEQANSEATLIAERIEKLEQTNQEIPVLSHRILLLEEAIEENSNSSGSALILTYEDASDEERAVVREAAECTSKLIGENINPILIDEIEKEIWKDLESGSWESFEELRLGLSIICADQ